MMLRSCSLALVVFLLASAAWAQTSVRLPLPVDSPLNALSFETASPVGGVLAGVLLPASGPLTSWAPVWATLQVDGSLRGTQAGGWVGPRPDKWTQLTKAGFVVGGFRVLVKTGPGATQTRQAQIFWKPWVDGTTRGETVTSPVYGQAAGSADEVKIIELKLPEGSVPIGLYGQTVGPVVVQVSLLVRQPPAPPATAPVSGSAPQAPRDPTRLPSGPSVPAVPPVLLSP